MASDPKLKNALLVCENGPLRESLQAALCGQSANVRCATWQQDLDLCSVELLVLVCPLNPKEGGTFSEYAQQVERAASAMAGRGFGRVLQIVFAHGSGANTDATHLRAAELRSITTTSARRYASRGVTVNLLELSLLEGLNDSGQGARELLRRTPLARAVSNSELAAAVSFLAAPEAAYMTGVCLPVTGGLGLGLFPEQLR